MNDEQRKLVEDNHNLIYACLRKYNLSIDEYYDVVAIGLCKAAITFDEKSECAFSTYAYLLMQHEIDMVFRHNTRKRAIPLDQITYYQNVISDSDGKETERLRFISDNVDIESEVIANDSIKQVRSKLKERDRIVFDLLALDYRQKEIGKIIGCSQPHISRIKRKIIKLLEED